MTRINEHGQPIGPELDTFDGAKPPKSKAMKGRFVRLEPLRAESHTGPLFDAFALDTTGEDFTYMSFGPFPSRASLQTFLEQTNGSSERLFFAIVDNETRRAVGFAAYLRIAPEVGSIEIGCVMFSRQLQRTPHATEAMYLMMKRALDSWGYRRLEWKCDALNAKSRKAATRLGFTFEGVFRNATIYKGRSRDTAWFSIIAEEWPSVRRALEGWLRPSNFDEAGEQVRSLASHRGKPEPAWRRALGEDLMAVVEHVREVITEDSNEARDGLEAAIEYWDVGESGLAVEHLFDCLHDLAPSIIDRDIIMRLARLSDWIEQAPDPCNDLIVACPS